MLEAGDVICPDGVDVTVTANTDVFTKVLTFTFRVDLTARTLTVLSFDAR